MFTAMTLEGRWCPFVAEPVLLRGGGLALSASGRFVVVLLHFYKKRLLWPMTHIYPYPMAEVFSRLEYRNVCVAT